MMKKLLLVLAIFSTMLFPLSCKPNVDPSKSGAVSIENELVIATRWQRESFMSTSGVSGYYNICEWPLETDDINATRIAHLTYLDYANHTNTILCHVPGCLHNAAQCTGYIEYPNELKLVRNVSGNRIFLISYGFDAAYSDYKSGKLYSMQPDGSQRQEVFTLSANEEISSDGIVVAGENSVFLTITVGKGDTWNKQIQQYDMVNGSSRKLRDLQSTEFMVDAFGDHIIIADCIADSGGYIVTFFSYSLSKNKTEQLYTYTPPARDIGADMIVQDGFVCESSVDPSENTGELRVTSLRTGDVKLMKGIPAHGYAGLSHYYDGILHWTNSNVGEVTREYFVNVETEEVTEKTLFYTSTSGEQVPVSIVTEIGSKFLVVCDTSPSIRTVYDQSGTKHEIVVNDRPRFALMEKKDYFSNIPNYEMIEDDVFLPVRVV